MVGNNRGGPVITMVILTPLVIGPLVLLGVYLGFYIGDSIGYSRSILAVIFSTLGFVASIFILVRIVTLVVKRASRAKS